MKRKRLIAAVLALLLAGGGAGSMWWYAQGADERALASLEPVDVFVATSDIPAGTLLGSAVANQWIVIQQVPKRLAPLGAGVEVDATNSGNVAVNNIATGEFVLLTRFAPPKEVSAGLSLPAGMIAMSLTLSDPQRVGPFVKVGSQVAVFVTFSTKSKDPNNAPTPDGKSSATRLLLSNLLILGVGAATGDTAQSQQVPSALLTVAVTQKDAERLIQAMKIGTLYMALMSDQSDVSKTPGVSNEQLFG